MIFNHGVQHLRYAVVGDCAAAVGSFWDHGREALGWASSDGNIQGGRVVAATNEDGGGCESVV